MIPFGVIAASIAKVIANAVWTIVYQNTIIDNSNNWGNYSFRQTLARSAIDNLGTKGRLTIAVGSAGLTIVKAVIGVSPTSGSMAIKDGALTTVTFGGQPGVSSGANVNIVTDEFVMPSIGTGESLSMTIYCSAGDFRRVAYDKGGVNVCQSGYRTGDFTTETAGSGWNTSGITQSIIALLETK